MRLIEPETAVKVVTRDIYWTVPFLVLYLERCDDLGVSEPREALELALFAPRLARLIGVGSRPGEYTDTKQKDSYEVLALAVLAGLCRRAGQITDAQGDYAHAFAIADGKPISVFAYGELLRRYGMLQTVLCEPDAFDYLDRAVTLFRDAGNLPNQLADALNTRGHWSVNQQFWKDAARDFADAMVSADQTTPAGKRTAEAAVINLAFTISTGELRSDENARALELVQAVRSRMGGQRLSETKCRLLWMEGLLYHHLNFDRQAARVLARARKSFLELKRPIEFTVVSLDLAAVLITDGENERYERLREHTEAVLVTIIGDNSELLEALRRWQVSPPAQRAVHQLQRIKARVQELPRLP